MASHVTSELLYQEIAKKLDPAKVKQLDRIVAAGMKVMFGRDTHTLFLDEMAKEGDFGEKMGDGVARLVVLLFQSSKGTMPKDLIVPAASILVAKANEYLERTGEAVQEDDYVQAIKIVTKKIMMAFGASEEHFQSQQPQQPMAQAQQPQGLIGMGA